MTPRDRDADEFRHLDLDAMSRRRFLRITPAGLLVAGGLSACSGDSGVEPLLVPEPDPPAADPARAGIRGPAWGRLPASGSARLRYSSEFSSTNAVGPSWTVRSPSGQETGPLVGADLNLDVDAAGSWRVRLTVENAAGRKDSTELITDVLPALSIAGYAVPLVWRRSLNFLTSEAELAFAPHPGLSPISTRDGTRIGDAGLSWNPAGTHLAYAGGAGNGAFNLHVYDLATGASTALHTNGGIISEPCWSRSGEWIAYRDDVRIMVADELTFIRPDGTGLRYPSGEAPKDEYLGGWPSWSPDDTRLAMGNTRFYPGGSRVNRIAVYSDPLGAAARDQLNAESALASFFERHVGRLGSVDPLRATEGNNGCAWSPGGRWIAYPMVLSPLDTSAIGHALVIADAAGSGDIHLLDWAPVFSPIGEVSWAPDERYLYYIKNRGIFRIQPGGGPPEDLTAVKGEKFSSASVPTLYR